MTAPSLVAETPSSLTRQPIDRDKLRRVALVVVGLIVLVVFAHSVLGAHLNRQAQDHLTDEYLEPAPFVASGEALGVLQIPAIELDDIFVEGIADEHLRRGPGHHPSSALPGTDGAAVLVGRRSQFGGNFGAIDELVPGDRIVIKLRGGGSSEYAVREVRKVSAPELEAAVAEVGASSLALVTSGSGVLGGGRVVVSADLVGVGLPAGETATVRFSDVRGSEVLMWIAWVAVAVVLAVFARRALRSRTRLAVLALLVPIALFVAMRIWLAASALLPMTY